MCINKGSAGFFYKRVNVKVAEQPVLLSHLLQISANVVKQTSVIVWMRVSFGFHNNI